MEAHDRRLPSKRLEGDSPQVNSSMKYFAQNLEQHLDQVLEYVVKDEGPTCGPPVSTPPLTATVASHEVADSQDAKVLLTSESSKVVITKSPPSPVEPEEARKSAGESRRVALEWLAGVRWGRHKQKGKKKKRKLGSEKKAEEEVQDRKGARTPYHAEESGRSSQQGRIVPEKTLMAEEGSVEDVELSASSCDSDDSEEERSKLEAVAVTFVGGVMQPSHKS